MTGISPDSPLRISAWIPMALTVAGLAYVAAAVLFAPAGH